MKKKVDFILGATRSILKVGNKMFSLLRDINVLFLNNSLNPDFWLVEITPSNQNLEPKFKSQWPLIGPYFFQPACMVPNFESHRRILQIFASHKRSWGRLANRDKACAEDQVLCPYALTLVSLPILFSVRQNRQRKVLTSCRCFWLYFVRSSYKV